MRKTFILLVTVLIFSSSSSVFSLDRSDCVKIMSDAKTEWGGKVMFAACIREKSSFYNRSKNYKCAKKAMKQKTEIAAKLTFADCKKN